MTLLPGTTSVVNAEATVEPIEMEPLGKPYGEIAAENVSEADYMEYYAASYHEYVRGYVVRMSPVHLGHDRLTNFLRQLLESYFALRPGGQVVGAPFVMRLSNVQSRREPDLQIILNEHLDRLKETYTDGAADICIEVVSPSNAATDYGEKLLEYEAGGVREYWMFDPQRLAAYFYRLNEQGVFISTPVNEHGEYETPLLPGLRLHVATLWQDRLPTILEVIEQVHEQVRIANQGS